MRKSVSLEIYFQYALSIPNNSSASFHLIENLGTPRPKLRQQHFWIDTFRLHDSTCRLHDSTTLISQYDDFSVNYVEKWYHKLMNFLEWHTIVKCNFKDNGSAKKKSGPWRNLSQTSQHFSDGSTKKLSIIKKKNNLKVIDIFAVGKGTKLA